MFYLGHLVLSDVFALTWAKYVLHSNITELHKQKKSNVSCKQSHLTYKMYNKLFIVSDWMNTGIQHMYHSELL